jgi:hypothetical protein
MYNSLKIPKNIYTYKKMDIEMIPEEDEERLKTENETGKKFYDSKNNTVKQEANNEKKPKLKSEISKEKKN